VNSLEFEGETIESAVDAALTSMGVQRSDVDVEILAQPSRGLFGLGGRKARVRVTRRTSHAPGRLDEAHATDPAAAASVVPASMRLGDEVSDHARRVLEDLVRRMGFASQVAIEAGQDGPLLQISGDNTNVLIGKHGQTLDALEYLVNRIVSREEEAATRIHVDCEQYRVKRQRSVEQLALRMGEEAKRKGRSVTLNPMSPRDRRIVHLTLQGDPGVTTRSAGDGFFRQVVISPEGERRRGRSRER
jgi:spoIIIJ-associated protein